MSFGRNFFHESKHGKMRGSLNPTANALCSARSEIFFLTSLPISLEIVIDSGILSQLPLLWERVFSVNSNNFLFSQ